MNVHPLTKIIGHAALAVVAAGLIATHACAQTSPAPWRIEVLAVPSKTLTSTQFLSGIPGRDVVLGGELRLPVAMLQGKVRAVLLLHGSGGIGSNADAWARTFNEMGIAAFIVDSFSGRGIAGTVEDQTQLDSVSMMVDAYRALDVLAAHRLIKADRIAVMGFSKGAVAAVFSSSNRFRAAYGSSNQFVAHIGMYTPCNARFVDDVKCLGRRYGSFMETWTTT